MAFQKPFKGLITIKGTQSNYYVSLYLGESWVQRDNLATIKEIAKERGITKTKIVDARR